MKKKMIAIFFCMALFLSVFPLVASEEVESNPENQGFVEITGIEIRPYQAGRPYQEPNTNPDFGVYAPGEYDIVVGIKTDDVVTALDIDLEIYKGDGGEPFYTDEDQWYDGRVQEFNVFLGPFTFDEEAEYSAVINASTQNSTWWTQWTEMAKVDTYGGDIAENASYPIAVDPMDAAPGDNVNVKATVFNNATEDAEFMLNLTSGVYTDSDNISIVMGENYTFSFDINTTGWAEGQHFVDFELFVNDTAVWEQVDTNENTYWFNLTIPEVNGSIEGYVADADGALADVMVYCENNDNASYYYETETNATGYYFFNDTEHTLMPGTYTVWVDDDFYYDGDINATVNVAAGVTTMVDNLTITYKALATLNGTVKDADGTALEGANITMVEDNSFTATTDVNGTYLIEDIPVGSYDFYAGLSGYYDSAKISVNVIEAGSTQDFTLDIHEGVIFGYIDIALARNLTFADGAKVMAGGEEYTVNDTGYYELFLPLGNYNVTVNLTGYIDVIEAVTLDAVDEWVETNITITEMFIPPIVDGKISGYVADADNASAFLKDVTIVIYSEVTEEVTEEVNGTNVTTNVTTTTYFNTTTNATGYYASEMLLLGDYYIYPMLAGYEEVAAVMFTLTAAANMVEKNLTLKYIIPTYTLTITVTPADANVRVNGVKYEDFNGTLVIEDLTDGDYTVKVGHPDYVAQEKNITIDGADLTENFVLVLKEVPPVNVTIDVTLDALLDADGNPIADATVEVIIDGTTYTAVTDANGIAVLMDLPEGTVVGDLTKTVTVDGETKEILPGEDWEWVAVEKKAEDDDDLTWLWILLAVIAVIAILIIVIIVMKKGKKEKIEEARCPECGATVQTDMEQCPECGYSFIEEVHACPECGEELEPDATMCDACGTEMVFASKDDREKAGQDLSDDLDLGDDEEEDKDLGVDDFEDDEDGDDDDDFDDESLDEDFDDDMADPDDLDDFDDLDDL